MATKRVTKKSTPKISTARRTQSTSTRRSKQSKVDFQNLETRQLMSTVNVASFGAVPNDGRDDTGAIQAAMNASRDGDTLLFSGGTFNLSGAPTFASNRTYLGQNGGTLAGGSGAGYMFKVTGDNVTLKGLTLNGGGVFLEKNGGRNTNIRIENNTFNLNTGGENPNGITFTSGLNDSVIKNNLIQGPNAGFGMYGYNYKNVQIVSNTLLNLAAGMHIDAFGDSGNLLVQYNFEKGIRGMGMEFQGSASNLKFLDNWYEHPNLSGDFNRNNNSFAYSLILDKSSNIEIKRNVCIAPERPDGTGCRIAFEVGGENTVVEDNYVNGVNHVLASNDGVGGSSIVVRNNHWENIRQGPGGIRPGAMIFQGNNGPNAQVSYSLDEQIKKLGVNGTAGGGTDNNNGGGTDNGGGSNNGGSDEEAPIATPVGLKAISTGVDSVNLFWTDKSYNESKFVVYASTDGSTWKAIGTTGANAHTYSATGLKKDVDYQFKVVAFNDKTNSKRSNIDVATPTDPRFSGTYVSDLEWTSSENAWGKAERDRSNGEQGDGDGNALSIDGATYAKGIGVHAGSEITVALGGKYSTFLSSIGLDDETDGNGSVTFQVWADGVKVYDSGVITANLSPKDIAVDVSGVRSMKLVVTSTGDNHDFDHADWGLARLKKDSSGNNGGGNNNGGGGNGGGNGSTTTYISELPWSRITNGWGKAETNKSVNDKAAGDGRKLSIGGKTYTTGLGVHSYSEIHYSLNGLYGNFATEIGIDDEVGDNGSVDFQVWADGVKLYDSGVMTGADAAKSVNVNVEGRNELVLIVTNAGDNTYFDHADWANARLVSAPKPIGVKQTYISDLKHAGTNGTVKLDAALGDDENPDDDILTIHGRTYGKGLGVSGGTKVLYNLNGGFSTFVTDLGIDDEVGDAGSAAFQIWADGAKLYDSGTVTGRSGVKSAEVSVAGVKQLWLVVTDAGDGKAADHADWANARLIAA